MRLHRELRQCVSFQSMLRMRLMSASAASASAAEQMPHDTATRSPSRVSFALPAAVSDSLALALSLDPARQSTRGDAGAVQRLRRKATCSISITSFWES